MKIFEGKSPAERNKIIAAIVIGVLAVLAIGNLIFAPFSGRKPVSASLSPSPAATVSTSKNNVVTAMPKQEEMDGVYSTTAVSMQNPPAASDAGRNIFAFYEPPIPTPYSPTPTPLPVIKTPLPTPTPTPPNVLISYISRQSVYAGEKGFKLEIGGDKFTPETYVYFGGNQIRPNYISGQQLSVDIPANFIATAGQKMLDVHSPDGKLFSNPVSFNVQAPPLPQFSYIGPVKKKLGNNDSAYIKETGNSTEVARRLGDIIGGRFRLISVSRDTIKVQDKDLGFSYTIEVAKGSGQNSTTTTRTNNPNFPNGFDPNPQINPQCPPGIPCTNLRPYIPPTPQDKKDVDDDNDDDGDN